MSLSELGNDPTPHLSTFRGITQGYSSLAAARERDNRSRELVDCALARFEDPSRDFVYHGTSVSAGDLEELEYWIDNGMPGRAEDGLCGNSPASIPGLVYVSAHSGVKYAFGNQRGRCALVFEFRLSDLAAADGGLRLLPDEDFLKGLSIRHDPRLTVQSRLPEGRFNPRDYDALWAESLKQYGSFAVDGLLPLKRATRLAMFDRNLDAAAWLETEGGLNLNLDTAALLEPFFAASTNLVFEGTRMPPCIFETIDGTWYSAGSRQMFYREWDEALKTRQTGDVIVRPSSGWIARSVVTAIARRFFPADLARFVSP